MSGERVLVTGATGFVGAAVARALIARGNRVRVLVRPTSDRRNIDGLDVEPVTGSLEDTESLAAALAAGVRRIVYTSSVATLGQDGDGRQADETVAVS